MEPIAITSPGRLDPGAVGAEFHVAPLIGPQATLSALQLGLGWFPERAGGLERFYYELLDALPAQNVNCRGLVVGSDAIASRTMGRVTAFAEPGVFLPLRLARARSAVKASLRSGHFDLVVSHFALYAFPSLGLLGDLPLVVHFHGPWAEESHSEGLGRLPCRGKRAVERAVYRRADRLICLSAAFAEILHRSYGIDKDRTRVIPGAVDVGRFAIHENRAAARGRLEWPSDRPIVLSVRRLVHRMGLDNLIDAAAMLRREVPDVLVLIAGRGPLYQNLHERIAAAGLQETVKLLGFVPDADLPLAYRAADLTVVPSTALEGFGLVAAESLAAGTPALVAPVGGLPEVVRSLSAEMVLPGSSAANLAQSLAAALRGRRAMPDADACATYARTNFDWSSIAARIRGVYEEARAAATSRTGGGSC